MLLGIIRLLNVTIKMGYFSSKNFIMFYDVIKDNKKLLLKQAPFLKSKKEKHNIKAQQF